MRETKIGVFYPVVCFASSLMKNIFYSKFAREFQ